MLSGLSRPEDFKEASRTTIGCFHQLSSCSRSMKDKGRLLVLAQDTGGSFSPIDKNQALIGGLGAFVKTAGREWGQLKCMVIDIKCDEHPPHVIADALFKELVFGGLESEIGLCADGRRIAPEVAPADMLQIAFQDQPPLEENDVLLVSGGVRGVTDYCLLAWPNKGPYGLFCWGGAR